MHALPKKFLSGGSILVASLFAANICNFLFNAYLARALTFEEFGLITLVVTIWNFASIPFGSLAGAVNHRVAYLNSHDGEVAAVTFFRGMIRKTFLAMLLLCVGWIVISPLLSLYFHVNSSVLWILAPAFFAGALSSIIRGYFSGIVVFGLVGLTISIEAVTKLLVGIGLTATSLGAFAYIAIPVSTLAALSVLFFVYELRQRKIVSSTKKYHFPKRFFTASVLSGMAVTAFLSFDVMLAKHYLDSVSAGQYAFLSLVGKMVFFFGSLLNSFVITFVARDEGAGHDTYKTFYRFLLGVVGLSVSAFVGVGLFGHITIPLLFGAKAYAITPYLLEYAAAITLYTITSYLVLYHLARKHYSFSFIALCMAFTVVLGIVLSHDSIGSFTHVLFIVSIINFIVTALFHFFQRNGKFILRNFVDLLDVFSPIPSTDNQKKGTMRILILNWRDMRHVFAGGAEVYVHELAKRWVKQGHSVTVFCGNDSFSQRNEVIDGVKVIRRGGFYFVYFWAFIYYLTQFRGRYDAIIDCHNGIPFFTPLYVKERVICVVHHIHQEVFRTHLSPPLALLAQILENTCMPLAYKNVQFVAVSGSTKSEMKQWKITGEGISIVHNGIDELLYSPGEKSKHPIVLHIGRLKYYKSLHVFIRAASMLHQTFPSAKFIIAGDGEERKGLTRLIKKLNAESYIELKGKISEEEKVTLYQQSWVFVNPSKMEGWGITTIEANACGTPVVASRVPGLSDSVVDGKNGLLIDYGNIELFSQAIQSLLIDVNLRKQMDKFAIEWSRKFRWDESANQFMNVLKQHAVQKEMAQDASIQTVQPINIISL